jgi:hypothetical protein
MSAFDPSHSILLTFLPAVHIRPQPGVHVNHVVYVYRAISGDQLAGTVFLAGGCSFTVNQDLKRERYGIYSIKNRDQCRAGAALCA